MTIREAITSADLQRPNQIAESEKLNWLNELEGLVQTRILHLSTDALTSYLPEVSYTGTMSFPDAQTLLLASAGGFCIGDTVKISGLTAYSGNNDVSAKVLSVSADGRTLTFAAGTFPAAGAAPESGAAYADRRDTVLIVPTPYDRIYEAYLMMRINLYMGEASGYNNDRTWYNTVWDDFSKWFSRNHVPGTTEALGFFLTAYGLALKNGFVGTEQEWLQSLKGDQGWNIGMRYSGEDSALQWCSLGDGIWHDLLTLSDIQGDVVSQTLTAAQTAQSGAETAQAAAESAKADAETARDSANISASSASASALTAEAAQMASESARDTAMAAKTVAETASAATAAKAGEASASASAAANNAAAASASAASAAASAGSASSAKTAAEAAQQAIENMTATALPLAEGVAPTVEKTVSDGAVSLGFGIPKGDTGATGVTGPQGYSIGSVTKKSGTGTAGSTDVYSVKIDDEEQTEVGTFSVYNGADGEGSGDMLKSQYDADNDGVVDDAERLGGQLPGYYAAAADLSLKAGAINGNPATADIAEADYVPLYDTSAAAEKKTLWSTVKSTLKAYFDGLYAALSHTHTKSQITDFPALGTAAAKDVPASGNAGTTQVVMGSDSRLSDSRPAADVSTWAKAAAKPSYTAAEVGADTSGAAAAAVTAHNSAADAHSALFASIRKIGEMVTTTRNTLGENYLLCNGDKVDAIQFPELCSTALTFFDKKTATAENAGSVSLYNPSLGNPQKIRYCNGLYFRITGSSSSNIYYSTSIEGPWTSLKEIVYPSSPASARLYDIAYGNGYYVIAAFNTNYSYRGIYYSTDLVHWTYMQFNSTYDLGWINHIFFVNGQFVLFTSASANNTKMGIFTDPTVTYSSWTWISSPINLYYATTNAPFDVQNLIYDAPYYVFTTTNGRLYYATDLTGGFTGNVVGLPTASGLACQGMFVKVDGVYYCVLNDGYTGSAYVDIYSCGSTPTGSWTKLNRIITDASTNGQGNAMVRGFSRVNFDGTDYFILCIRESDEHFYIGTTIDGTFTQLLNVVSDGRSLSFGGTTSSSSCYNECPFNFIEEDGALYYVATELSSGTDRIWRFKEKYQLPLYAPVSTSQQPIYVFIKAKEG